MSRKTQLYHGRYSRAEIRRNRIVAAGIGVMVLAAAGMLLTLSLQGCSPAQEGQTSSEAGPSDPESVFSQNTSGNESGEPEDEPGSSEESAGSGSDTGASAGESGESSSAAPANSSAGGDGEDYSGSPYYEAELPLLVNPDTPMPDDFTADVVDLGNGYKFDRKASKALNAMLDAAKADGVNLWIISAYRSLDRQKELYAEKVAEYESYGYSPDEAAVQAAAWVAVPGTSEHCLGYATDLNSLEESFENTKEFAWLQKHCADYGFILRFPKDKVDITGISYEPWHYRYVGINHAKPIMAAGICLEEYLEGA